MTFDIFTLLTDEEAKRMARREAKALPPPEEIKEVDVQYVPGAHHRFLTKKERRRAA